VTTLRKQVRARKARYASTCPACHGPINVHDPITSVDGSVWKHADCAAAADRASAAIAARYGRPVESLRAL
jgi:hypothetical protein